MDFDDLILIPVVLFRDNPDVLEKWQFRIRYMLVDEYQDTNASQYLLVKMLVGTQARFTVVGDDDQSTTPGAAHARKTWALLKEDFPHLKVVMLEQNYRSTSRILRAANTLIANNPHVFEKQLWSELGYGEPLRAIRCRNEEAEAERVAVEIQNQHHQHKRAWRDFAILYRGNHQARLIRTETAAPPDPLSPVGRHSFFSRQEVKDLMSYLRLLGQPG
ncbi:3'-5' exonuclease [Halopseudomonas pachastrellae]|nr:3'-5' exonuclease [Halopseudomonas pachastrellae]